MRLSDQIGHNVLWQVLTPNLGQTLHVTDPEHLAQLRGPGGTVRYPKSV
jgi:hypothetical protein